MKHISKERREAVQLREKIKSLLAERDGWRHYEDQRDWLRELLGRDAAYIFTERERTAVARIAYMRTFFDGWDGHSVQELIRAARKYMADFDHDDFLNEIEHATRLTRGDMGALVGLCRTAGLDIERSGRKAEEYEEAEP
jgi:hypothetical protein